MSLVKPTPILITLKSKLWFASPIPCATPCTLCGAAIPPSKAIMVSMDDDWHRNGMAITIVVAIIVIVVIASMWIAR